MYDDGDGLAVVNPASAPIELNAGRPIVWVTVSNTADRPIQVSLSLSLSPSLSLSLSPSLSLPLHSLALTLSSTQLSHPYFSLSLTPPYILQ